MSELLYIAGVLSAVGAVNLILWMTGSRWRFGWFERNPDGSEGR